MPDETAQSEGFETVPRLEITSGPDKGQQYELSGGKYVLGRHPDCEIVVDVGSVSRQHCQVLAEGDRFFIEDLHSRNGTLVNGNAIQQRVALAVGDMIQICDVSFRFLDEWSPPASPDAELFNESSLGTLMFDDDVSSSIIMSKVEVSTHHGQLKLVSNAEVKLAALVEINRNLGQALALDEVLPKVLDSLFKIFVQADRGFIILKNLETNALIPRWTKLRRESEGENLRVSRTIINEVMETREAILSADAKSDSRFEMSQSIADFRIRSMMCAPLVGTDSVSFGVLQIDTLDQRSRFQPADLEVLASVASQAAIAINSAQMHEAALREREIQRDLELAKTVQKSFLPGQPPRIDGYRFYDYYQAANQIGGDYFDYVMLSDGRIAVIVADVVGHGIAAALLMAKLSAEVRTALATCPQPAQALTQLNARLAQEGMSDRFITFVMAVLDPHRHEVTVVNAGHMLPIVRRRGSEIEEVGEKEAGIPLSIDETFEYEQVTTRLEAGDFVTMYTDGINEAMDPQGQLFTVERIRQQVSQATGPELLGARVIADLRDFVGDHPQNDDVCLVCFGRERTTEAT